VDRTIALLGGRAAWAHDETAISATTRLAAAVEIAGFVTAHSSLWAYRLTLNHQYESTLIRLAPIGFTISAALLCLAPLRVARGRPAPMRTRRYFVLPRSLLGLALVVTAYCVMPGWPSLITWPIGVAIGADAAMTSWVLGWQLQPLRWWGLFLSSPLHLGLVGGLLGAVVHRGWSTAAHTAVPIFVAIHLWVIVAGVTAWLLSGLRRLAMHNRQLAVSRASSFEHRRSAHWLHDDLCAQLRLVSIKVQSGGATLTEVAALLDDLDHQMRLRQLEEILESGTVRIAEVLQPYVRRAQNHGVTIDSAPSFDDASLVVTANVGREFSHAAAVLTSNALNAGATHIEFEVQLTPGHVSIAVIDNAGGLDAENLPSGRSLWTLREDLGDENVVITPTETGSRVKATIALTDRSRHDAVTAR
jgi:signal transduction histidine kinase